MNADSVYVLTNDHACYACGCIVPVHALLAVGPFSDVEQGPLLSEADTSAMLRHVEALPSALHAEVATLSEGRLRIDDSATLDAAYLMNHCRECDAKIGDWYVGRPGDAFFPTTSEELAQVKGVLVPGPHCLSADVSMSTWTDLWLAFRQR